MGECRPGQLDSQTALSLVFWPASGRKPPNREVHCSPRETHRLTRFETSFSIFSSLISTSAKCNCSSSHTGSGKWQQNLPGRVQPHAAPSTEALVSGGTQGRQGAFHFYFKIQREGSMFFKETEHMETGVQNSSTVPFQGTMHTKGRPRRKCSPSPSLWSHRRAWCLPLLRPSHSLSVEDKNRGSLEIVCFLCKNVLKVLSTFRNST